MTRIVYILFFLFFSMIGFGQPEKKLPNIILIYIDDMGYGDVGFIDNKIDYTPNFNFLATNGVQFSNFYVSQSVCTASRASVLTGSYANRLGLGGAIDHKSKIGLNPKETTIAEILKTKNYRTAAFGKWHLGFQPEFLPTKQGFDEFCGIPYSNDMWPYHPENPKYYPALPLYENEKIIDTISDQSWFTKKFTEKSIEFILKNESTPFFIYLAPPMPHVPLFLSQKMKSSTGKGIYADVIHELDWAIGEILQALRTKNLEDNTLLILTSDNGPWLAYGNHAGETAGLREGKGTSWEGGVRVPFVAYWKNRLPAGKLIDIPAMTIDILPTITALAGASLPVEKIDGINIWPLISGKSKTLQTRPLYFYYNRNDLEAMRWKKWKLYFPHTYRTMEGQVQGKDGLPGKYKMIKMENAELYDLAADPFEKINIVDSRKSLLKKLNKLADRKRKELGDDLVKIPGKENREPGRVTD